MNFLSGTLDVNTLVLLMVAMLTAFNTYYSRRTEKNTNSMKDALIDSTSKLAHAAGRKDGLQEAATTAASLADRGVTQGKAQQAAADNITSLIDPPPNGPR